LRSHNYRWPRALAEGAARYDEYEKWLAAMHAFFHLPRGGVPSCVTRSEGVSWKMIDSLSACGRLRTIKGYQSLRFRTAFGDAPVRSPRWCRCRGETPSKTTYSPQTETFTMHTAPQLEYLEAKWAAKGSFSAVAELLHDVCCPLIVPWGTRRSSARPGHGAAARSTAGNGADSRPRREPARY